MDQKVIDEQSAASQALENLRMRFLDLTSRNRLINFRHTKKGSLRVIDELPNQLVETLLNESEMRFEAVPEPSEEELIAEGYFQYDNETEQLVRHRSDPSAEEWAKHLGFATGYEMPDASSDGGSGKHADTGIQTLLYPYEMEARLKSLLQASESAIQEMGTNILYLAFGFLEWYESSSSASPRIAPLFLVPIKLHKGRLNSATKTYEYTLTYSGEDIVPNLSLREKLRSDFALALPDLDESTIPEDYFREVNALITDTQSRWRVRRYVSMALLDFSKLLMYLDLDPARWPDDANIVDHPVVSRFLSGYGQEQEEGGAGSPGFGDEYPIDDLEDIQLKYPLIDDADSSQHSALIDAVDGKNLVIEGPPGTGKSQTITNLIAAAIAQGKKVLFVAEKLAALEVVRSRLDQAGLGEFCLELHSHKSQKSKVLDEIGERLKKHEHYRKPVDIEIDIARYEELKSTLKNHAKRINRPWKNTGRTLHEIFMAATRYRTAINVNPEELHPDGYDGSNFDPAKQRRNQDQVQEYRKVYQAVAHQRGSDAVLSGHPWYGVLNGEIQYFDLDRVKKSLSSWQEALEALQAERHALANTFQCDDDAVPSQVGGLQLLLEDMEKIPALEGDEWPDCLPLLRGDGLKSARSYLELFEVIQSSYSSLAKVVGPEILKDLSVTGQLLSASERLDALVGRGVQLGSLAEAVNRLDAMQKELEQIDEPLQGLVSELGEPALKHLRSSESGLTEFMSVVDLVAGLDSSLWKCRDDLFDNEELDAILPALRADIEELNSLQARISEVFCLEGVRDDQEFRRIGITLEAGGPLRWFKGGWRRARKELLSYAATSDIQLPAMLASLEDAATFVAKRTLLEQATYYASGLGENFRGLDTNLDGLEALRAWYKCLRRQYGVGFGPKVALGEAILRLSPSVAKAVRSLQERGMQDQVRALLEGLNSLKSVFEPIAELRDGNTLLVGQGAILPRLLGEVNGAVRTCEPLISSGDLTLAELVDRIEKVGQLKQFVDQWESDRCGIDLFGGRLDLIPGVDTTAHNATSLATLRHTVRLASYIDDQLRNEALVQFIYEQPSHKTFATLLARSESLRVAVEAEQSLFGDYVTLTGLSRSAWMGASGDCVSALLVRNRLAMDNGDSLQSWLDYVRTREQILGLGLAKLVDAVESAEIEIDVVEDAYAAGMFDLLAREIFSEDREIARFSGYSQEAIQDKFREYDNNLKKLQCEQIAWNTDQTVIPAGNSSARISERTERALLLHECGKKTRHLPIRQLLRRASSALVALKPCFMMGPMSVAQYLAPGTINFDLVIMDEASQIKPQDALGAVARGGQLVVVGDPKQLPPSSFFDRVVEEEEIDPTGIEESESILDATLPMFPARRLRWHYRSQHESLIAFSNYSFYDSDLVLFPSPHKETDSYGIKYSRVRGGCFVNRKNLEEARVISEAVREHSQHFPEETLGVVAMNAEQREHIERAIETLAKDDTLFQDWLDKDSMRHESLFVKNLENVQGDERDVIYISMTYGPMDPNGKVFQRFGPINSDVGWRRLNVLFTRSKKRMHIFSSMGSDDILLSSTSKRGVQALHGFLRYCESGVLYKTDSNTGRAPDSDFEISVIAALRAKGFECVPQVGVTGFFIDVAVLDPGKEGRYLMGIECDGATYHSGKSARDRDRLRQTILERLGWNIRRIWSTDWFKNPHGALESIVSELHQLKSPVTSSEAVFEMRVSDATELLEETNECDELVEEIAHEDLSLRDKLIRFDREVIRMELPDTSENKRLLRPAMLEALVEYSPTSTFEFKEFIPSYIRQATESSEGRYLDQIFGIINASVARPENSSVS